MNNAYKLIAMMWIDEKCEVFVQQMWHAVFEGLKNKEFKEYDVFCAIIIDEWEENPEKCYNEACQYITDVFDNIPTIENKDKKWKQTDVIQKAWDNNIYVERNL